MTALTYRAARADDAPALALLALEASWHHFRLAPGIFSEPSSASAPLVDPSRDNSTSWLHVAERDGSVVGFVSAESAVESRTFLHATHFARINLAVVSESSRGLGIGRRLVALAEQWARSVGCTEVRLNVWAVNVRAAALYEELGYRVVVTTIGKSLADPASGTDIGETP